MEQLKINRKFYKLYVNEEKSLYIFDLTDNDNIDIIQVKSEIERKYNVKINIFFKGYHKRYAKDFFKESNEYSFVFSTK